MTENREGEILRPPTPNSVDDLELVRERERQAVNEFLEQRHPLGSVPGWKACFSARYKDSIVAVLVLGRPVARMVDRWLARARRGVAYLLLGVAILAALGAERVDPDVEPPQYHGIRPQRGDAY